LSTGQQVIITSSAADDALRLAEIRLEAMRPSLEALDRYNPQRARDRFLKTFEPDDTKLITLNGSLAGFFVVREFPDHLYLDHLYIREARQGQGLGRFVVETLQKEATKRSIPIRLIALEGSRANAFYASCGFTVTSRQDVDVGYEWKTD